MPKKYRKKPVVVEALKTYWGQPMTELQEFIKGSLSIAYDSDKFRDVIGGVVEITPGDYIIKHECGRITTCNAVEFEAAYDEAIPSLRNVTVNINYPNIEADVKRTIEEVFKKLSEESRFII